ncbi:MAG TPA: hypothetical protein VED46_14425 [Alphaproteobacteria bacterium]|nr:hypothetical protein [Alphaproteobacteria bacterium]
MVQDVPNYLAHVEARAQWPLWILLLLIGLGGAAAYFWPERWQPDADRQRELARVGALFAEGHATKALVALDMGPLRGTAEAAFAWGVIRYYTPYPDYGRYTVQSWLRDAAEQGFPPAEILLGWALLLDRGCKNCTGEAIQRFQKALRRREDRDARLGLAMTWAGFPTHLDLLLAEPVSDEARLMALAFRSRDLDSELGAAMMKRSAEEGWSVAQFHYATRFLDRGGEEAMLWLAMAAAQGDAEAADMVKTEVDPAIRAEAERRLLAMAASLGTQLGKAARWCDRRPPSLPDDKRCRLHALEDHIICRLPRSTSDALGIAVFEETEAYSRCRSTRLEAS